MENKDVPPEGWEKKIDGLYYKRGRFGFIYVWLNHRWARSTRPESEYNSGIKEKRRFHRV